MFEPQVALDLRLETEDVAKEHVVSSFKIIATGNRRRW